MHYDLLRSFVQSVFDQYSLDVGPIDHILSIF